MEAERQARKTDRDCFRNLMQMHIVNGTPQQSIDNLPTTTQLLHQSHQQIDQEKHSAVITEQTPPTILEYIMHDDE